MPKFGPGLSLTERCMLCFFFSGQIYQKNSLQSLPLELKATFFYLLLDRGLLNADCALVFRDCCNLNLTLDSRYARSAHALVGVLAGNCSSFCFTGRTGHPKVSEKTLQILSSASLNSFESKFGAGLVSLDTSGAFDISDAALAKVIRTTSLSLKFLRTGYCGGLLTVGAIATAQPALEFLDLTPTPSPGRLYRNGGGHCLSTRLNPSSGSLFEMIQCLSPSMQAFRACGMAQISPKCLTLGRLDLPQLSSLSVSECLHVGDRFLLALRKAAPSITALNVEDTAVTERGLEQVVQGLPLVELRVGWCDRLDPSFLLSYSRPCDLKYYPPPLKLLSLAGLAQLSDLDLIPLRNLPLLRQVDVSHCRGLRHAASVSLYLPQVQILSARGCSLSFSSALNRSGSLQELDVSLATVMPGHGSMDRLTTSGKDAASLLLSLKALRLERDGAITSEWWEDMLENLEAIWIQPQAVHAHAHSLPIEVLSISECTLLHVEEVSRLIKYCLGLRKLGLNGLAAASSPSPVAPTLWLPSSLRHLDLATCLWLTDDILESICVQCPYLCSLSLTGCRTISDQGLRAVGRLQCVLEEVDISDLSQVTIEGLESMLSSSLSASLQVLDISSSGLVCWRLTALVHRLSSLHSLTLRSELKLTNSLLLQFAAAPTLSYLDTCHCPHVTSAGRDAIRRLGVHVLPVS